MYVLFSPVQVEPVRYAINSMAFAVFCLLLSLGCGSTDSAGSGVVGSSRGDQYVVGLEKVSEAGEFVVQLINSRPAPRYISLYSWTLRIRNTSAEAIIDASVRAEPMMLTHGHGTTPQFTVGQESESAPGEYLFSDLDLFMPGLWTIYITIETTDGLTDLVEFAFELGVED